MVGLWKERSKCEINFYRAKVITKYEKLYIMWVVLVYYWVHDTRIFVSISINRINFTGTPNPAFI